LHHKVKYPEDGLSFFSIPPGDDFLFEPKDANVHKPISISQFMNKKLRWITLGGQYDWTNKVYLDGPPPAFPKDTAQLLHGLFPDLYPQAAIVNFYSPGDTLSLHRDVAEECDRGLLSISIGCDGIFILGLESETAAGEMIVDTLAIRLRSGDAVYMDGASRFAWHGVPQIIPDTCPTWLKNWPTNDGQGCESTNFEHWEGWMGNKRINLNVRQMWD
jgi:alkylated DNA repair protein alkB family protein 1